VPLASAIFFKTAAVSSSCPFPKRNLNKQSYTILIKINLHWGFIKELEQEITAKSRNDKETKKDNLPRRNKVSNTDNQKFSCCNSKENNQRSVLSKLLI